MEHSFQEVMKERERMCHTIINANNDCYDCPLQKARLAIGEIGTCYRYFVEHYSDAKNIVMSWAAENPELVYPAWRDWLRDLYGNLNMTMTDILEHPIEPEIAQRLYIAPRRTHDR